MAFFYNRNGSIQAYIPNQFPPLNSSTADFGDGFFETIRCSANGDIPLLDYHWSRLDRSFQFSGFNRPPSFSRQFLLDQIRSTISANELTGAVRARLTIFHSQQSSMLHLPMHFIIETQPLAGIYLQWNRTGVNLVPFRQLKKQLTGRSELKLNNRIPYSMALTYAKSREADDAVVYNASDNITDSSIANIFWIKNSNICTPPLSEGPVAGVMRQWLLERLPPNGYRTIECPGNESDLLAADEIFLSNALYGIRQVASFSGQQFSLQKTEEIYYKLVQPLFDSGKNQ